MPRSRKRPPPPWGSIQPRTTSRGVDRFRVRYDVLAADGSRRQVSETVGSWDAALGLLQRRQLELLEGPRSGLSGSLTVAAYLQEWLALLPGSQAGEATQGLYAQAVRLWLVPTLGHHRLDQLSPPDVRRAAQILQTRKLAPRTVQAAIRTLSTALNQAVQWKIIPDNPARGLRLPSPERTPPPVWTREQSRRFLAAAADTPDGPIWRLLLDTGMRIGEALALSRDDVDLDAGVVTVRRTLSRDRERHLVIGQTTKTGATRRVPLSPSTVAALRRHLRAVREQQVAAVVWEDLQLVFPGPDGRVRADGTMRSRLARAIADSGVSRLAMHGLRHTNATLLLQAGVPITVVSARLGHRKVSMTLDVYAHVLEDMQEAATEAVEALFGEVS